MSDDQGQGEMRGAGWEQCVARQRPDRYGEFVSGGLTCSPLSPRDCPWEREDGHYLRVEVEGSWGSTVDEAEIEVSERVEPSSLQTTTSDPLLKPLPIPQASTRIRLLARSSPLRPPSRSNQLNRTPDGSSFKLSA